MANRHHELRVFGLLKEHPETALRAWVDQLIVQGFLAVSDGEYPLLQMTRSGFDLCKGIGTVNLGRPALMAKKKRGTRRGASFPASAPGHIPDPGSSSLFESLRRLRLLLARKQGIPPYLIFPDSVLTSLTILRPTGLQPLRGIKGIGEVKLARYGKVFLDVLSGGSPETAADSFNSNQSSGNA